MPVRLAHLSDLHLLDLTGAVPSRLFNKRATGYVNLKLKRNHVHHAEPVFATRERLAELEVDHVVVTGDVSNLALEREFDRVKEFLASLHLDAAHVSIVPGNHDAYTRGAVRSGRFDAWFAAFKTSSADARAAVAATDDVAARWTPFLRLEGPLAIIGLSTAVARPPLVASGELGRGQVDALARILAHPDVRDRTPVVLQHHPIHNPPSRWKTLVEGLVDAALEREALASTRRGLLLHGHLHRRIRRSLETSNGHIDAIGATSASLLDERPERRAGINVYDFSDDGALVDVFAERFTGLGGGFERVDVPRA